MFRLRIAFQFGALDFQPTSKPTGRMNAPKPARQTAPYGAVQLSLAVPAATAVRVPLPRYRWRCGRRSIAHRT